MANLKQIVRRLPSYLINKWGDVSYSIRENGGSPRLSDLAKFVKRQAAIKNDPGFVVERRFQRSDLIAKVSGVHTDRQTSNYVTDMTALGDTDGFQKTPKHNLDECPRCSGRHELTECGEFQSDEIQARWNIVKLHRLCHVCLKPGHMRSHCQSRIFCQCGADRRHHKLLHNPPRRFGGLVAQESHSSVKAVLSDTRETVEGSQQRERSRSVEQYATATKTTASSKTILLHVVPVRVIAPQGNSITTYGLLDNASRGTIISKDIANILCLEGQKELVSVNTIMEKTEEKFEFVRFQLQSAKGVGEIIDVEEGLVSERFNISEKCLPKDIDRTCHPHLRDIEIPEVDVKKVSVLIGKDVDYAHDVVEERKPGSSRSQLKGVRGALGWVITGTVQGARSSNEVSVNFTSYNKKLSEQIDKFWNLESFGTRADHDSRLETSVCNISAPHNLSGEDIRAVEILQKTTRMSEGHYETGLLWRDENVKLPNNRSKAVRRLSSLKRRFSRDSELEERYRTIMKEYVAKGYARKLTPEEAADTGPRTWYLPHFPVLNPNKPGAVRIVFDAAAEYGGTSLNNNLLQGPDCTNNLVGVLLRFRQDHTAIVADIESMFHQVKVREQDQDSLRFLWWDGGTDEHPDEYVMTVHIFGATDLCGKFDVEKNCR